MVQDLSAKGMTELQHRVGYAFANRDHSGLGTPMRPFYSRTRYQALKTLTDYLRVAPIYILEKMRETLDEWPADEQLRKRARRV